jgi:glycosyltransferase involved in cell wall biosynthesis
MRIVIVAFTGIYPINIGGPGAVAYFVSKWLGEIGDDVTLFVRAETKKKYESINQIKEFKDLKNVHIIATTLCSGFQVLVNLPYLGYKTAVITRRFCREKFDIVHYNSPPTIGPTILFPPISKLRQYGQTLAIHGGIFYESKLPISKSIIEMEKDWFDRVLVFNNFSHDLARKAGFKEEKIVVIPNGVEVETIDKVKPLNLVGDPKIIYVGRLEKIKGIDILLKAFSEFIKNFPRAVLYIIGEGSLRSSLQELARKLGIQNNVVFQGFIPPPTVWRYYKSADAVVLPSYIENFSIALLEAMASKAATIVSDAPGNTCIIKNGETGLIFPRGNWRELAAKMANVILDNNLRRRIINNAYQLVKNEYDWKKIALRYHETFQSILTK